MSGARPRVLLVPGWSDTERSLRRARAFLVAEGWSPGEVATLSFRDRYGCNIEHAAEVAAAAERLADGTPQRIAVVAHSMGGLAVRHYLRDAGGGLVETAIFAGTPHYGTHAAWLAWGRGGRQMRPGSDYLRALNAEPLPPDVTVHCLRTPLDTRILPGRSAWLEGASCHLVKMPLHAWMLRHRATLRLVRDLLLRSQAGPRALY